MDFFFREKNFTVHIFYGSEKGFAKSIAEELFKKIQRLKIYNINLDFINNFYKYDKKKGDITIFVISTTDQREFPENSKKIISLMKNEKKIDIEYSLLALGDSSYEDFCYAGKTLNNLLKKKTAKEIIPISFFDDSIHDNEEIDNWINGNINYITNYKHKLHEWFIKSMSKP
jgi:sulfite reductase (NADPH) flavoprotein alpha-component